MATNDEHVLLARKGLSAALLSDALDQLGLIHQLVAGQVRPLDESLVLCGRARTASFRDVYHADEDADPYAYMVALVDSLQPEDVPMLACGRSGRISPWGELMSVAAQARQAAGCVTDGLMRDTARIRAMGFPVFSNGRGPVETRGRGKLIATDVPVSCGGVWVSPGDLVFGDADGVVVVPQSVEADVIRIAQEKAKQEAYIREALRKGGSLREVYAKYRSL